MSEVVALASFGVLVVANVGAVYGFAVRLRTQFDDHRVHIDGRLDRLQEDMAATANRETECRAANEASHQQIRADYLLIGTYERLHKAATDLVDRDRQEVFKRLERLEGKVDALPARIQNGNGQKSGE